MRKLEITFGIVTLAACVLAIILEEIPRVTPDFVTQQVAGMLVLLVPAVLVLLGSSLHAVTNKVCGLVLLYIGGLMLTVWMIAGLFGGALYVYGISGGLIILSPGVPALIAMIISLMVRRTGSK